MLRLYSPYIEFSGTFNTILEQFLSARSFYYIPNIMINALRSTVIVVVIKSKKPRLSTIQ